MRKEVVIISPELSVIGGSEYLTLSVAKALSEGGFTVTIYTLSQANTETLREMFGSALSALDINIKVIEGNPLIRQLLERLPPANRLKRFLGASYLVKKLVSRSALTTPIIIDTQSNAPISADISYIHYPVLLDPFDNKTNTPRLKRKLYNKILRLVVEFEINFPRCTRAGKVLTNSSWTARKIYNTFGVIPDILHPPIDIKYFTPSLRKPDEKIIVTISRISPEKRLNEIVDLAKLLKDYKFIIIGSANMRRLATNKTLSELKSKIKQENVDNVMLELNVSKDRLRYLLSKAKYYLHPPIKEHFGIAVAEAMAMGIPPIVYKDGGAWLDLVSVVSPKLGYHKIEEVGEIITTIDSDTTEYEELSKKSREVAEKLDYEHFKRRLLLYINNIIKIKMQNNVLGGFV